MNDKAAFRALTIAAVMLMCVLSLVAQSKPVKKKPVELKDAKGNDVGTATIISKGTGVEVKLDLKNLPPGEHAVHAEEDQRGRNPNPGGPAQDHQHE